MPNLQNHTTPFIVIDDISIDFLYSFIVHRCYSFLQNNVEGAVCNAVTSQYQDLNPDIEQVFCGK